jgi:hypothetical protein
VLSSQSLMPLIAGQPVWRGHADLFFGDSPLRLFTGSVPLLFKCWQARTDAGDPDIGKSERNVSAT